MLEIQEVSERLPPWSWEGSQQEESLLYNCLYGSDALCGRAGALRGWGGTVGDLSLQLLHFLLQLSPLGQKLLVAIVNGFLQGNVWLSTGRSVWKREAQAQSCCWPYRQLWGKEVDECHQSPACRAWVLALALGCSFRSNMHSAMVAKQNSLYGFWKMTVARLDLWHFWGTLAMASQGLERKKPSQILLSIFT